MYSPPHPEVNPALKAGVGVNLRVGGGRELQEYVQRSYKNMSKGSKFQDYLSHYQPLPRIEFLKRRGWRGQSLQDPTVGLYFTGG